jgi:peroxiredoxin
MPLPVTPRAQTWTVRPQLPNGLELVYAGTFKEDATGSVQFSRAYRFDTRVFVLEARPNAVEAAVFTVLRLRDLAKPVGAESPISSARLERIVVGDHNQITASPGVNFLMPFDGPNTLETGFLVDLPGDRLSSDQTWMTPGEADRPVRTWRVAGTDLANGTQCIKLVGEQKTTDWDQPRGDRLAWRRVDTVWLAPRLGVAYRLERVLEKRDAGRGEVTQRSVLRCELESNFPYTGQLFEDRRNEVVQAMAFAAAAAPLLPVPAQSKSQLSALSERIAEHIDRQPPTPYREAVLQVRRRVEAGKRGEVPVVLPTEPSREVGAMSVGETAPEFVVPDFRTNTTTNLKRWLGKPVLLVFYRPSSSTAIGLLHFAQKLSAAYSQQVTVLALAVTDDGERVRQQADLLHCTLPLLNGSGLTRTFGVETTPKLVLLEGNGVVRASYLGWGPEIPDEIVGELNRLLGRK